MNLKQLLKLLVHGAFALVFLSACGGGGSNYKKDAPTYVHLYKDAWLQKNKYGGVGFGGSIYKKKENGSFKFAFNSSVPNMPNKIVRRNGKFYRDSVEIALFDKNGKLQRPVELGDKEVAWLHGANISIRTSKSCAPSVSEFYAHEPRGNARGKCTLEYFDSEKKLLTINNVDSWNSFGTNKAYTVVYLAKQYSDSPLDSYVINTETGEVLSTPGHRLILSEEENLLSIDRKTQVMKIFTADAKPLDLSAHTGCSTLKAMRKGQNSRVFYGRLSCKDGVKIIDAKGATVTQHEYRSIEPYSHNRYGFKFKPNYKTYGNYYAVAHAVQTNGKHTVILFNQYALQEYQNFPTYAHIQGFLSSLQKAKPMGSPYTKQANRPDLFEYSGVSTYTFEGKNLTIATVNLRILPNGDWKKGQFYHAVSLALPKLKGYYLVYSFDDQKLYPIDDSLTALATNNAATVYLVDGKLKYAVNYDFSAPRTEPIFDEVTTRTVSIRSQAGGNKTDQYVLAKKGNEYHGYHTYEDLGIATSPQPYEKHVSQLLRRNDDWAATARRTKEKEDNYNNVIANADGMASKQLYLIFKDCTRNKVDANICKKLEGKYYKKRGEEAEAYNASIASIIAENKRKYAKERRNTCARNMAVYLNKKYGFAQTYTYER